MWIKRCGITQINVTQTFFIPLYMLVASTSTKVVVFTIFLLCTTYNTGNAIWIAKMNFNVFVRRKPVVFSLQKCKLSAWKLKIYFAFNFISVTVLFIKWITEALYMEKRHYVVCPWMLFSVKPKEGCLVHTICVTHCILVFKLYNAIAKLVLQ